MSAHTESQLREIFRAVFNLPATAEVEAISQATHPEWDSLAHVTITTAVESEFGIEIEAADSMDLTSFDAVRAYVASRLG